MTDETIYYPEFGRLLPNGNLLIPTAGRSADGERLDGRVEVSPDDPNYGFWLARFQNREQYLANAADERMRARQQRRAQARDAKESHDDRAEE